MVENKHGDGQKGSLRKWKTHPQHEVFPDNVKRCRDKSDEEK